jgi:heme-degrading monooxygenase HmoA
MIMRIWRGVVATDRVVEYVRYIEQTGLTEYADVPGSEGAQMVTRDLGGGRTEVMTVSWWDSLTSIRGFAGDDIEKAKYYPEDDDYLLEHDDQARHYVVAGQFPPRFTTEFTPPDEVADGFEHA